MAKTKQATKARPVRAYRTPREARTYNQICERPRDWKGYGDWSLMISEGVVVLSEQAMGESRAQHIEIPRRAFNALIDWYNHGEGRRHV